MKKSTVSLVLAGTLALTAFSASAAAQAAIAVPPPIITVTGNADVEAVPDEAVVRIGIVRQQSSAKDAQDEASKIGQAILNAIRNLGVPAQQIQTTRLTISPTYAQQQGRNGDTPRITGYSASNSISVTLENLMQIGPVVDAGLDNGANRLDGVQFRLKNEGPVREMALRLAVADAKGKATAMADALSMALGPVVDVSETGVSVLPLEDHREGLFAEAARATPTTVSPGQLEITGSVVLKYAIVPKN